MTKRDGRATVRPSGPGPARHALAQRRAGTGPQKARALMLKLADYEAPQLKRRRKAMRIIVGIPVCECGRMMARCKDGEGLWGCRECGKYLLRLRHPRKTGESC